jgi:hypothetical protein
MMNRPKAIDTWDFPDDLEHIPGWNSDLATGATEANLMYLINRHNELLELTLLVADKIGIEFTKGDD